MNPAEVLYTALIAVLVWAVFWRRPRSRAQRTRCGGFVMRYGAAVQWAAAIFAWGGTASLLVTVALPVNRSMPAARNMVVAVAVILLPAILLWCETRRRTVLLTLPGIVQVRTRGSRRMLTWHEVSAVRFSSLLSAYIVAGNGKRLVVPDRLDGLSDFAMSILQQVPEESIQCKDALQQLAAHHR